VRKVANTHGGFVGEAFDQPGGEVTAHRVGGSGGGIDTEDVGHNTETS